MKKYIVAALLSVMTLCGIVSMPVMAVEKDTSTQGGNGKFVKCPSDATFNKDKYVTSISECYNNDNDAIPMANKAINVVVGLVGFVAVVMIVIGGIGFATSQGDTAKTTKARNTILYGVIGLVVAVLAFAIVNFVLGNVFK